MINKKNRISDLPIVSVQRLRRCALLLALAGLGACSSSTTPSYYTLTPRVTALPGSGVRVIEVMPVGLPDRLNRTPLVLQDSRGQSTVLDNARWTSTLAAELRDGLSAGLQQKLGAVDRYNSGMTGGRVSYRIATDFSRFDIVTGSGHGTDRNIEVAVSWMIKRDDPNQPLTQPATAQQAVQNRRQFSCRMAFSDSVRTTGGNKIADIVSTSRLSLSRVVDAIAASVVAVETGTIQVIEHTACA
ncbi:PqiC family protein [Acinetobacter sp. WZC-1]|uniref:PqiC family protein n=1 Tax=Acinetobacter sp. WZC-1 TaxID=3459034 RepID=UPI00403DB1DE